jgi:5-methylcytosine-specific restriction endonuclease McrA
MSLPELLRQQVRDRAKNRCEYCLSHQDYIMGRLQIDHILPIVKGGTDDVNNLCLACELCNQSKWKQTEAIDPETQSIVLLFNPRTQIWKEHFKWAANGTRIVGLSSEGRATVSALKLNNPLAVRVRSNWVQADWHPPD